jgi:putative ATP-binding cassette transporter
MPLTELLLRHTRTSLQRLGLMAVLAGAASTAALAVVSAAAEVANRPHGQALLVGLFGLALLVYVFSQKYVLVTTTDEVERIVDERRRALISKLARCELLGVEKIGHGAIFTAVNSDAQVIAQSAGGLVLAAQALILMFWMAVYLATLSLPTLGLVVLVLAIAARIYRSKIAQARGQLRSAHEHVTALHEVVEALLGGFKEVKLSSRRAQELLEEAMLVSGRAAWHRSAAQRALAANFIFSQVAIFLLLGTLVFVLPALSATFEGTIVKSLAAVLFLIGPISGIISSVPQLTVANNAAESLMRLDRLLDEHQEQGVEPPPPAYKPARPFQTIALQGIHFTRGEGDERFSVGPIDLTIRRGETLFITGGNGSGKTTLVKLLTGLYPADAGAILVDGHAVTPAGKQAFRDMFGAVFSDFHLFRRLYGSELPDANRGESLIAEMEIADKAHLEGRAFSTIDLSTGQRKRLALVAAQLEDRPVLVLDEWAADQDPHFRAKFYEQVLPRLRAEGRTIIAITHDDRYFRHADRRVHMEEGRIVAQVPQEAGDVRYG